MIFVTVGTHEQQFNRLVEYMDKWSFHNNEDVVIQTGFSSYIPINCKWSKFFSYSSMLAMVKNARIVITHGGPSSFILPLQVGKIPIVVPRDYKFNEHVNNHQIDFCDKVATLKKCIILVRDIDSLGNVIHDYNELIIRFKGKFISNNEEFCNKFKKEIELLI